MRVLVHLPRRTAAELDEQPPDWNEGGQLLSQVVQVRPVQQSLCQVLMLLVMVQQVGAVCLSVQVLQGAQHYWLWQCLCGRVI